MSTDRARSQSSTASRSTSHTSNSRTLPRPNVHRRTWSGRNAPEACASTAEFLLYAQDASILIVHHDTLEVARRFEQHHEEVLWIAVDNVSDKYPGRNAVSFDIGKTAVVWNLQSGSEISRFSAYGNMRAASFMRNGNIAFGNEQGDIILYDAKTSEHISARTVFDPITAIAPASDCRTFAIGYQNGSILIAALQPSFTILHTLNTSRAPSPIKGLAWHGSTSKQRTEMLATLSKEGDLRVWSIPKAQYSDPPVVIRSLNSTKSQVPGNGLAWFAWSKMGRLIQHFDGETRAWDVRTKRVTYDNVPTTAGVVAITNFGPTATLFTLGPDHTVQQYDVSPTNAPLQVSTARHAPIDRDVLPTNVGGFNSQMLGSGTETGTESGTDEGMMLSPLQKIAKVDTLDTIASELRDTLGPLSPTSYEDSLSSHSSTKGRRIRKYLYDYPSSRASSTSGHEGTEFSLGLGSRPGTSQSKHRSTSIRHASFRSADELKDPRGLDLFPFVKARLMNVAFRSPHYGEGPRTADLLVREMLSVVFGWHDDVRALVRDELSRHRPGSATAVLLSRWLGDIGADRMNSLIGTESMTSSDWMLLALSSIGADSQKKVGEAFVQRLLEINDVHPAVAILLGLGEYQDAIEVYVSQSYHLEAVLLTCLTMPSDWQRISHLLRGWGESATKSGDAALAVRCFSCMAVETTVPWRSPSLQNGAFNSKQAAHFTRPPSADAMSPAASVPSRAGLGRRNPTLKLITTFGERGLAIQPVPEDKGPAHATTAITPLSHSAMPSSALPLSALPRSGMPMSPGAVDAWRSRTVREPSSARTATPGGYVRKKRLPSRSDIERAKQEAAALFTPIQASNEYQSGYNIRSESRGSNMTNTPMPTTAIEITTALRPSGHVTLPSPGFRDKDRTRTTSRRRDRSTDATLPEHAGSSQDHSDRRSPGFDIGPMSLDAALRSRANGPAMAAAGSRAQEPGWAADSEAVFQGRGVSRQRDENRKKESRSGRTRDRSESHSSQKRKNASSRRSPTSPRPMSPEEIAAAATSQRLAALARELESSNRNGLASPVESQRSVRTSKSESHAKHRRGLSEGRATMHDSLAVPKIVGKSLNRKNSPDPLLLVPAGGRGRSDLRLEGSLLRSPSLPILSSKRYDPRENDRSGLTRSRSTRRAQSTARKPSDEKQPERVIAGKREHSASRKRLLKDGACRSPTQAGLSSGKVALQNITDTSSKTSDLALTSSTVSDASSAAALPDARLWALRRKELAARELEERRQSLARRPSAPQIPLPGEAAALRPSLGQRSHTDLGGSPIAMQHPSNTRTGSADVDLMMRLTGLSGASPAAGPLGLPATPRVLKHPRHTATDFDERNDAPPMPEIPGMYSDIGSASGSSVLSQTTGSILSEPASSVLSGAQRSDPGRLAESSVLSNTTWSSFRAGSEPGKYVTSSQVSSAPSNYRYDSHLSYNSSELSSTVSNSSGMGVPVPRSPTTSADTEALVHPLYRDGAPSDRRHSGLRGNVRRIVPSEVSDASDNVIVVGGIDAALHHPDESGVVVVVPEYPGASLLPELQHLADVPIPPPPPPKQPLPSSVAPLVPAPRSGVTNITIAEARRLPALDTQRAISPKAEPMTTSPSIQRRNTPSGAESLGSRIRGIGERLRSTSKSRTKSPTIDQRILTYDAVLPRPGSRPPWQGQAQRAQSPYEQEMAARALASRSPGADERLNEMIVPPLSLPGSRSSSAVVNAQNPREFRANVSPGSPSAPAGFL